MRADDLGEVRDLYEATTGRTPPDTWHATAQRALGDVEGPALCHVVLGRRDEMLGYAIGEVRSWEFGAETVGWVIGLAVDPVRRAENVGTALLTAVLRSFEERGVRAIRTMVQRDDVPVLRFFRRAGFVAGPYTQLELKLADPRPHGSLPDGGAA
jgi:ribosomal protein S18 acetylase RimI-like enzyme